MSDFLYELSCLIHCERFQQLLSLVARETSCLVNSDVQILHNERFKNILGTVRSICDWVSEKFHFVTTWDFSRKNVWNCDYQPQVCTIWKIKHLYSLSHHRPPKFSNFYVYTSPLTNLQVFFLKHHFMRKREMSFSFDWDLWREDFFIYNIDFVSLLIVLSEWNCSQENTCDSLFFKTLAQLKAATALFFS